MFIGALHLHPNEPDGSLRWSTGRGLIEKQALVWAVPWVEDDVLVVKWEYWSEGSDILSCSRLALSASYTKDDIESGIRGFVESIESQIEDSYGRRLLM